eukprot:scpid108968/ scgid27555/ 
MDCGSQAPTFSYNYVHDFCKLSVKGFKQLPCDISECPCIYLLSTTVVHLMFNFDGNVYEPFSVHASTTRCVRHTRVDAQHYNCNCYEIIAFQHQIRMHHAEPHTL